MSKKRVVVQVFFVLLVSSLSLVAQEQEVDFQGKPFVDLQWRLNKAWRLDWGNKARFDQNWSSFARWTSEFGVRFAPKPFLKFRMAAVYILENDRVGAKQGTDGFLRGKADFVTGWDVSRVRFSYRFRYQLKTELGKTAAEDGDYLKHDLRHRFRISYNVPKIKLTPAVGFEFYQHFEQEAENGIHRYRVTGDLGFEFTKMSSVKLRYLYEYKNDDIPTEANHSLEFGYVHMFRK